MMNKCQRCGYEWRSIKNNPIACPRCKRYDWKTKVQEPKLNWEEDEDD